MEDFEKLRRELERFTASSPDVALDRYRMQKPIRPPGLYWQMRWLAGRVVALFESVGIRRVDRWPVRLKHAGGGRKPLLIWALGADRQALRRNCAQLTRLLPTLPAYSAVLVTDVADFAHFSRLGWLVEYLPDLAGTGESFQDRKARFLLRLYSGAPVLPAGAEWPPGLQEEELRLMLARAWRLEPGS